MNMTKEKPYLIIGGVGLLLILFIGGFFLFKSPKEVQSREDFFTFTTTSTAETLEETEGSEALSEIYVDVTGAVKNPGVYALKTPARVFEGIAAAGGVLEKADVKQVNQAKILSDQSQIHVPFEGEELKEVEENLEEAEKVENTTSKINLNTSDASTLQQLPGIGAKKAEAIVQYRKENGSFQKIEDLTNVAGIGEGTFTNLKELITIK